ncbi:tetratricopeptide repeat protein [Gloeobacter kilaueensis]|uniref:Tetratricopeptide repeat protein n=1 Tax=Gloeobacter kilaueensis (strain ATCC BAA-2537 / CCAP 1431/1 / ULC 316 / JS1) TaxID=1183438 RepID=U5QN14_GLOK1|nr:tetratricopeptide repeat protein [Gloeobacter kilaueensis]AGY60362.1 hypothetical protein GKIL_4116 [Gloeobacter kilaueensis JS1]
MSDEHFERIIAQARTARSPAAIAHLLKPVLFEMAPEFEIFLERLVATTPSESSAARTLRLIARVWRELQSANERELQLRQFIRELASAGTEEWPALLVNGMDPNGRLALSDDEWQKVAALLEKREGLPVELAVSLRQSLAVYLRIEANLLDWLYTGNSTLGFTRTGPWGSWAALLPVGTARTLLEALDRGESARDFLAAESLDALGWIELTVLLRRIERHLVRSFEQRYPNLPATSRVAVLASTFLTFAIFWADFAQALVRQSALSEASFQNALQILRAFASQPYFPLYGGLLAIFDGPYLRAALTYMGEPLRLGSTPIEKAKLLNLLGYTARLLGDYPRSLALHREALEALEGESDPRVRVANLINQGSTQLRLREFAAASELFERALVYARQVGDRTGQAHALANLGNAYSLALQFEEVLDPERYELAAAYLQQGLEASRQAKERPAEMVALTGLGALQLFLNRAEEALPLLEQSLQLASGLGDLWWEGTARAALAEALVNLDRPLLAVGQAAIAMLTLDRVGSIDWRQPASLLVVLRTRLGDDFNQALQAAKLGEGALGRVEALLRLYLEPRSS